MQTSTLSEQKMVILNVDDDERGRYVVTRQLKAAGFDVREASSGAEALAMATSEIDVVLLDVDLPDINGFEVCRRLKASSLTHALKIVHLSACIVAPQDKAIGLDIGADAYLTEPIEATELVATLRSMVRLRQAERKAVEASRSWESTFNAIRDGVWLIGPEARIERCNRAMLEQILCLEANQVIGASALEILENRLKPEDRAEYEALTRSASGGFSRRKEFEIASKWYHITADWIDDESGRSVQTFADITARKRAEIAAAAAQKAKTQFLANVSHELRTPLSAVLGYSDLLADGNLDAKERMAFNRTVQRNGRQLGRLIDDLLDLSKAEEDRLLIEIIRLDLRAFLDDLISGVRLGTEAKGIGFSLTTETRLPDFVETDPTRLKQIVMNLTSNAIKFTDHGAIDIRVAFEKEGDVSCLLFSVCDTGIGLSETQQQKIFQPFVQADSSTSRQFGGTGLGLALSRKLAEKLNGRLWLESSQLGQGSRFGLKVQVGLPKTARMFDDLLANAAPDTASEHRDPVPLKGRKILLVEDSKDNQWLFMRHLEGAGATVAVASDGFEALEKAADREIALILMDIQMPKLDGYETMKRLRESGFARPIIALTAHALAEDRDRCMEYGCFGYLTKPVQPRTLISAVADAIRAATH